MATEQAPAATPSLFLAWLVPQVRVVVAQAKETQRLRDKMSLQDGPEQAGVLCLLNCAFPVH